MYGATEIVDNLLKLKLYILQNIAIVHLTLSKPINRTGNEKDKSKINEKKKHLEKLNLNTVDKKSPIS